MKIFIPMACALLIFLTVAVEAEEPAISNEYKSIHQLEWEAHRDDPPAFVPHIWPVRPLAKDKAPAVGREILGYYPYWVDGYQYMRWDLLTTLAYFCVDADGEGNLTGLHGWPATGIVDLAHANGVRVVVTLVCFSSGDITSILSSPANRQNLIDNLLTQVTAGNADGVNVDFEGVSSSQRTNLTTFMGQLTRAFHDSIPGSHITMATPAVDWSSAFDYDALADSCDGLMIMGYGYRWSGSSTTGPVSPLINWGTYNIAWTVNDYLNKTGNDRDKIILGLPYYGRDWACDGPDPGANTTASGTAKFYSTAEPNARTYGKLRDEVALTPWYRYQNPDWHQCWYDDEVSLGFKETYINDQDLAGMGIWALRYDEGHIALWNELEEQFGTVPNRLRVENQGDGSLRVSWGPALGALGYRVYRSPDGVNFDDYIDVSDTTTVVSDLNLRTVYYFKVSTLSVKGETPTGEVLAARTSGAPAVLVVSGYDRPKTTNTRDFILQHAASLDAAGVAFDACANEAVEKGQVLLTDYEMVDWILGEESTQDESFDYAEQDSVSSFLMAGGNLFVSGAETGWDLDYKGHTIDKVFYNDYLKADYAKDDAGVYAVSGVSGTIFAGLSGITFDNGEHGTYDIRYPDCLNTSAGSTINLTYDGTAYKAGIQYEGIFPGGSDSSRLVNLGFPLETVYPQSSRDSLMSRVLDFFGIAPDMDQTPPMAAQNFIATLSISDIQLAWSPVTTDTCGLPEVISHYVIYRSASLSESPGDSIAAVADTSYLDVEALGNPLPIYYTVRAVDTAGYKSADSQRSGAFSRDLQATK